jgi:hypothetical protein
VIYTFFHLIFLCKSCWSNVFQYSSSSFRPYNDRNKHTWLCHKSSLLF